MTIKEAEKATGLSSRNIRFYEQKGLLSPVRNRENDYREYSDGDIERLKMIRALRMVDMPLEQIRDVLEGRVELHDAAIMQKERLEEQIKKLKTVIKFCEELSEVEPENMSEVLLRMDQPENRKFLSKQWRTDYAEKVKRICIPLFAALVPALIALLLFWPILLAGAFAHGYMLVLSLLILACWGWLGNRLYSKERWVRNAVLFAVFPVIALLLLLLNVPMGWEGIWYLSGEETRLLYFIHYFIPLSVLTHRFQVQNWHYLLFFAINMGCFGLGMLLRWNKARRKEKTQKRETALERFFAEKPVWRLLCVGLPMGLVICLLAVVPAFVGDLSPDYYDPALLYDNYTGTEECLAQTEEGTVWFEITEEFAEIARFHQWERKYWRTFGKECLKIDEEQINAGADLKFYDNNCVIVHVDGWKGGGTSYSFRVPEGVLDELEEYIWEHTVREATEE